MLSSTLQFAMTSLYDTLQDAGCLSQELWLSPATFKSSVDAIFKVLRDHQISATVIAKLPRETLWYESLEQYRHSSRCQNSIYLLKPQTRRGAYSEEPETSARVSADVAEADLYTVAPLSLRPPSPIANVWLPAANPLRHDFFVLVLSSEFQALLLAHRPPKSRLAAEGAIAQNEPASNASAQNAPAQNAPAQGAPAPEALTPQTSTEALPAGSVDKATLRVLQSFEPDCLAAGLNVITSCVEALYPQPPREITPMLEDWLYLSDQISRWSPNISLWNALWTQQLSQQERLWQTNTTLKPQAELGEQLYHTTQRLTKAVELKDDLSKLIGQELRSPLSSMKTALSILSSQTLKPAQRQRYIDMLTRECDRQNALISGISELAHLEEMSSTPMEPLQLIDIVPGVVSTYQPLAQEQGVMLAYTVPDDLPPVACLGSWLKQIVINLLDNGIKFTPQKGQVWVKAYPKADYIQLEVQDTGAGIPPADIDRVFERFYRAKPKAEDAAVGVGLGLSIVQQLVLKCGGSISVESELGRGATFFVSLPIYREG